MTCNDCDGTRGDEDDPEGTRGPRSPYTRRGETLAGGGGRAIREEEHCGGSGSGDEEREPGWEKVWSLGGI